MDGWFDVLHGVADGEGFSFITDRLAVVPRGSGGVDVKEDRLLRVIKLQVEQLRDDQFRDAILRAMAATQNGDRMTIPQALRPWAGQTAIAMALPQFIAAFACLVAGAATLLQLNANCGKRVPQHDEEHAMNTHSALSGSGGKTLAMIADFSEIAVLGLGAGLVFSLVAGMLVVIVTTLN